MRFDAAVRAAPPVPSPCPGTPHPLECTIEHAPRSVLPAAGPAVLDRRAAHSARRRLKSPLFSTWVELRSRVCPPRAGHVRPDRARCPRRRGGCSGAPCLQRPAAVLGQPHRGLLPARLARAHPARSSTPRSAPRSRPATTTTTSSSARRASRWSMPTGARRVRAEVRSRSPRTAAPTPATKSSSCGSTRVFVPHSSPHRTAFRHANSRNRAAYRPLAHAHPQGVYYEVNLQTQVCTKGKLQGPFIPHGVGASVRPPAACSPAQSPTRPSSATTSLAPAPTLAAAS